MEYITQLPLHSFLIKKALKNRFVSEKNLLEIMLVLVVTEGS